jgi:hypothetical protein
MCALGAQSLHHMPIVNDFMADVDRRAIFFEGALDDLDRSFDPRAKASGLR